MADLERLTPSDYRRILPLAREFFEESLYKRQIFDEDKTGAFIRSIVESPEGIAYRIGDEGFLLAVIQDSPFGHFRNAVMGPFYVRPASRGSRLAWHLMNAYIAEAERRGVDYLEAEYLSGIPGPVDAFYAKMGFIKTGSFYLRTKKG